MAGDVGAGEEQVVHCRGHSDQSSAMSRLRALRLPLTASRRNVLAQLDRPLTGRHRRRLGIVELMAHDSGNDLATRTPEHPRHSVLRVGCTDGLRDPDRDRAPLDLTAGEYGHLVLVSVHSPDGCGGSWLVTHSNGAAGADARDQLWTISLGIGRVTKQCVGASVPMVSRTTSSSARTLKGNAAMGQTSPSMVPPAAGMVRLWATRRT